MPVRYPFVIWSGHARPVLEASPRRPDADRARSATPRPRRCHPRDSSRRCRAPADADTVRAAHDPARGGHAQCADAPARLRGLQDPRRAEPHGRAHRVAHRLPGDRHRELLRERARGRSRAARERRAARGDLRHDEGVERPTGLRADAGLVRGVGQAARSTGRRPLPHPLALSRPRPVCRHVARRAAPARRGPHPRGRREQLRHRTPAAAHGRDGRGARDQPRSNCTPTSPRSRCGPSTPSTASPRRRGDPWPVVGSCSPIP